MLSLDTLWSAKWISFKPLDQCILVLYLNMLTSANSISLQGGPHI